MSDPTNNPSVQISTGSPLLPIEEVRIEGNRVQNPISNFVITWRKFLFVPSTPAEITLDALQWTLSSAVVVSIAHGFTWLVILPFLGVFIGLAFAIWYVDNLRLPAVYRLGLLLLGVFLGGWLI